MKRHTIALMLASALLGACSNNAEKEINRVAQHYIDATSDYDIDKACQYCTEETAAGLRDVEKYIMPLLDSSVIANSTPAHSTITATVITSDSTAEVSYHKKTPMDETDGKLNVVKRNSHWMIHAPSTIPAVLKQGRETTYNYDTTTRLQAVPAEKD